ncbi:mediator of RNA polymerase II transcription subunit 16 [Cydia fagiglandana]|uniref:mediator of RNA polymerase II transcription subunit 16 n=1 Tax=Cydia fagiglandana TaxID=1458189 RepID=UPI002FEE450D
MELIYSMRRKPLKCEPPHFETSSDPEVVRPICTISACNIIAFSSPTELSDSDGCTWGGHVYVCDLDTPWDSHKVTSTVHPVSALEWDSEGKQLLVATTEGEVSVYGMKEFLLNDWGCLYSASFPGEHVIKAAFFHNGRRVSCDKKPDVPAAERLQLLRPTPTLKGFGGIACEGACIITATGLIGALTPSGEPGKALSGAECLRPARDRVPAASVAHKNGTLIVAAGGVNCVRCAVCSVTLSRAPHQAPSLIVQPLPAVYLDYTPVSLTWSLREDTDSLLIAGSTLSVWNLTQRAHPVHKLLSKGPLQGSTTPGGGQKPGSDCFNTVVWQQISVLPVEGCAHVCSRRLHAAAPHHVLAATGPNRLLLHRDTHRVWQQISVLPVEGCAHVCSRRLHAAAPHHVLAATGPNRLLLHRDTHRVWQQISVLPVEGCAHVCSRRLHAAAPHHVLAATGPNRLLLHRDTHRVWQQISVLPVEGCAHMCSRRLHAAAPHHVLAATGPNRLLLHRDTHRQISVLPVEGCAHVCSRRLHAAAPHHVLVVTGPNRLLLHRDTHRVWQQISVLPVEGCAHVCSRRLHVAAPHHVLAATGPNRLLLHRDTHRISTTAVTVSGLPGLEAGATPPKKPKYGGALATGAACAIVSCVDMSWLGGVCVCVDTHAQLHVYRLPAPDISTPLLVQHTTSLLEYAMVSGLDYRDIIMTLKPNAIDAVYERFTESFQRQPQAFQQFYYQNWLKLRIALCRVMPTAQGAVSSLTQLTTLAGAWAALAAALRGDDRRHDDVRLDALLEHEHDKALVTLEAKAELSSDAVVLTPLRRILQQCVDIATTHLQHAAMGHTHPYETWTDGTALTLLRKLLVAARAAGRGGEPLSRALARLQHQNTKEVREECATLCLQLTTPRIWDSLPRCTVSAPHGKPPPHYFEYGIEPEGLRYAPEPPNYGTMCEVMPSLGMDCIRYMYLGAGAGSWRSCGRCGARALPAARPARLPAQRAYDGRFLPACRCGGKWTLVSNY